MNTFLTTSFQDRSYPFDQGRIRLKESLINKLKDLGAELDLVKSTRNALNNFPDLQDLRERIRYPEEIVNPEGDVRALAQLIHDLLITSNPPLLEQLGVQYQKFLDDFEKSTLENRTMLLSPKVRIEGDLIEPYRITQEVALDIISNSQSIRPLHVTAATKKIPLDIGMEISVYLLHVLLFGKEIDPPLAPSSLLKLENVFIPTPRTYSLQVSTAITGTLLESVCDRDFSWNAENFSSLVIASFLTIPSNCKPCNYILCEEEEKLVAKVIGIGNKEAFVYPLMAADNKQHTMAFKNPLFCFEKMMDQQIAPKVRERIGKLEPILLGVEWASAVSEHCKKLSSLNAPHCKLPLRFTKNTLYNLIANLQKLQKVLANPKLRTVTHRQLFRLLFPVVERYYLNLCKNETTTREKVNKLFSPHLATVESSLNLKEKLEDGRTIKEALVSVSNQTERNKSIEELCIELLRTLDLSLLPPHSQSAILSLAEQFFNELPMVINLHPSWKSGSLPFLLISEGHGTSLFPFLKMLEVDFPYQNSNGDTLLHFLIKHGAKFPDDLTEFSLDVANHQGLTPLDIALDQKQTEPVIALIEAGAGTNCSAMRAWEFYKTEIEEKGRPTNLDNAFKTLAQRNQTFAWKLARELIFSDPEDGIPFKSLLYGNKKLRSDSMLWDENDNLTENPFTVTVEGITLNFKQAPEFPGMALAIESFMQKMMGFGVPHNDLILINGNLLHISQNFEGMPLQDAQPAQLAQLDKKRLSQLLLTTMLLNPVNGNPRNYVLQPLFGGKTYQIVCINNDHAFVNQEGVKTILFCLNQMLEPIYSSVKEQFLRNDPAKILTDWLKHLSSMHELYNALFSEQERELNFIGIPREMIGSLYRKMVNMQSILTYHRENAVFTHMDLLKMLEPAIGRRYSFNFNNNISPFDRFYNYSVTDQAIISRNDIINPEQALRQLQSEVQNTLTQSSSTSLSAINVNVTNPVLLFKRGQVLESREPQEAINNYLEAARMGHSNSLNRLSAFGQNFLEAQYALGCYYELPNTRNISKAAMHYAAAASGTHLQAAEALGNLAEIHPTAKSQLALLKEKGRGIKKDIQKALSLHEGAADWEGISALHLGLLYQRGYSTNQDRKTPLSLIEDAEKKGISQASRIKELIQKENREQEQIIQNAATSDDALYRLANRKSALLNELEQNNHFIQNRAPLQVENEIKYLQQRINELKEEFKKSVLTDEESFLNKQIDDLRQKLNAAEETYRLNFDPMPSLNKKRTLFYTAFKKNISVIFEGADAVVSGTATRNISFTESQSTSAAVKGAGKALSIALDAIKGVPFAGHIVSGSVIALEWTITQVREVEVKKQCKKVREFYPVEGAAGADKLAALLASSLVYRFQDFIIHLKDDSLQKLTNYFTLSFAHYLFGKAEEDSTFKLFLGSTLNNPSSFKSFFRDKPLHTDFGMEWQFEDLLFSTGVQTIYGGKYLPKKRTFINALKAKSEEHRREYPQYRWGTKEEINMLAGMGIEMECIAVEREGALPISIDKFTAEARFIQEAELFSNEYLK